MKTSVILSVFAIGLEATFRDISYFLRHSRQFLLSFASIYLFVPLTAGIIILIFSDIHPAAKIAIFSLSVSPIPPLLPRKHLKTGGTLSYIIGLLVAMSLLAIIVVPLLVEIFSLAFNRPGGIFPSAVAQVVLSIILIPLAIGLIFRYLLPNIADKVARPILSIGSVFLLFGSSFILFKAFPAIISLIGSGTIFAIILFVAIALAIGHTFGGPVPNDRTALALSTVSRHPGIALAIAGINFPDQKLSLAAVILYLVISTIVTTIYLKIRQRSLQQPEKN
ncbi:bile acid:sodium symporter family protein [Xenococcus sp. PCC 7305]|uniref:bile acid:sodium symporter family protein n=1 Tax=Xenococcus sp. PCC 7305 TaxID=102125 RepID=UPI001181987F|nr:Na+-dependent transporter [Xenococcus sp. PCC 7305]